MLAFANLMHDIYATIEQFFRSLRASILCRLDIYIYIYIYVLCGYKHKGKSFLNLINPNQIWIVIILFL